MDRETFKFILFLIILINLLSPVLAIRVKKRYKDLGYKMKANPYFSNINLSLFWPEAYNKNKEYKDKYIRNHVVAFYLALSALILIVITMLIFFRGYNLM